MYRIKKAAAAIYGWDRALLTFIYPGFEHVAQLQVSHGKHGKPIPERHSNRQPAVFLGFLKGRFPWLPDMVKTKLSDR